MNSIRIENLRCFKDTGQIELKPLTIAVGKNSSGKSTLLRTFPLFKQTFETKLSEPILWYGRYVDFGEYSDNISKYSDDNQTINFEFKFMTDINFLGGDYYYRLMPFFGMDSNITNTEIIVKIYVSENIVTKVDIDILGNSIQLIYNEPLASTHVNINNSNCGDVSLDQDSDEGSIIPNITSDKAMVLLCVAEMIMGREPKTAEIVNNDKLVKLILSILNECNIRENQQIYMGYIFEYLMQDILDFPKKYNKIRRFLSKSQKSDNESFEFLIRNSFHLKKIDKKRTNQIIEKLDSNKPVISQYIIQSSLPQIISACNSYINKYFKKVKYIAPVRATAERYYRKQGLDIQDVDSRGENVSAILQGMKSKEREKFNDWVYSNFGFKIYTKSTEGHISLYIDNGFIKTNIADTGFGYSQILPIILMLWKNNNIENNQIETQIVIEQPELHLHPKMQIQLLELILKIISQNNKIRFLIETHSEILVNYLGPKIENNEINDKMVSVLLIEQLKEKESSIRCVNYSPYGYLEDWPIDFFLED